MQKNHAARRGAGIEIGSSRRRCGVWWYNKKQASSEKIPGTLLYNWQAVLCQPLSLLRRQGRVAAPSVCFAVARILLAAAPTAPPCFRRWRRSSPLLPKGEPLACRPSPRWASKAYSIRKQQCPATKASSSLTRNMVPQLLPSVAGHYFLRYIRLPAASSELTDMPMALPLGELAKPSGFD